MKRKLLSVLLVTIMLLSCFTGIAAFATETEVDIVFYNVMTKEAITSLEGVGSTYAKINFTSPQSENVFVVCATYDGNNKFLKVHVCESVSTNQEYTTQNIDLTGARTIKLLVFDNLGNLSPLCASKVLTRTTDDGSVTLNFDEKNLVTVGAYDPEAMVEGVVQGAYDNTVTTLKSNITGKQSVNNNMPKASDGSYVKRNNIYTAVDLSEKLPAKKVTVSFLGTVKASATSNVYINLVDECPKVGDELITGTRIASAKMAGNSTDIAYTCDITEAYNKAVGSKLYLRMYGWYGYAERATNAVQIDATSLSLIVTPSTGDDFKVAFSEGAEGFSAGVYEEITLPECNNFIAGRKFAGWSDGKNIYQAGAKYIINSSVEFKATYEKDPETYTAAQSALDGKKVMFIGNSYVYYGNCVLQHTQLQYTWAERNNDKGYFYQLCKENNIDVTVRNWCFSGHDLNQTFQGPCSSSYADCKGVDHESHLEDKYLDYVIISLHASDPEEKNLDENIDYVMNYFREANPNVKFVLLGNHAVHGVTNRSDSYHPGIIEYYKTLEEKGFIIADWGEIISDIVGGKVSVPGATETYNQNTFVNTADGHHENELAGYITALSAFCAITDESAIGQPYAFCSDASLHKYFDLYERRSERYKNDSDTNFIEVFNSPSDMLGLQKLVDRYINPELLVPVTLTLNECDDAGTTTYEKGEEVTLPTPVKSAKTREYTFTGWSDGTNIYEAGEKIVLNQKLTLTATWTSELRTEGAISFDDISLVRVGAWQEDTSTYDNTVKSITSGVTGNQDINANKSYESSAYINRPFIYACIDLKNEIPVEKATLNLTVTPKGKSSVYIYEVDGYPSVGEEYVAGTQLAKLSYTAEQKDTAVEQTYDITEAFNRAVGSKLYLRIYGSYGNASRYRNSVKLNASSLNLSFTAAE